MHHIVNVEVRSKEGESPEKFIKKFFKKCKKSEIVKEYLDKTSFFKSKRQKRKEKKLHNQYIVNKDRANKKVNKNST